MNSVLDLSVTMTMACVCVCVCMQVFIGDLLKLTGEGGEVDTDYEVYVYDQCTTDPSHLPPDCFLLVLLSHLASVYSTVRLIQGNLTYFFSPYNADDR
jgi:hypothetical protein